MATPHMTTASHGRTPAEPSSAKLDEFRCPPMSHQDCGGHGHEMHLQQFVRLVGCHDASHDALHKQKGEKLH